MQALAITGANGFLGHGLISECIELDCFKLRLLTRERSSLEHLSSSRISVYEGDLLKPESLNGFLQPNDTLIHLAYTNDFHKANIEATHNIIKAAGQMQVKRVIHCSTAVVVGFSGKRFVTEETLPVPKGEYQQTKYHIEKLFLSGLPPSVELAILRPTEIIGPGGLGLWTMIDRLRHENAYKNYLYHCLLKFRRCNYVSIHNVIAALLILVSTPIIQNREIYNISDDDDVDNNYAAVERIINCNLNCKRRYYFDIGMPKSLLRFLFRLLPNFSPPDRVYSHAKIGSLGYKKVATLKSTISEMLLKEGK